MKKKCPVCETDEFVTYIMGSHAEGRPIIIEGKEQHVQGDCQAFEYYECDKCGGEFSVQYEIHNGKTLYLKTDYKIDRPKHKGVHTWA